MLYLSFKNLFKLTSESDFKDNHSNSEKKLELFVRFVNVRESSITVG